MGEVRVRMYRQGLGDSFLLTFDPGGSPKHVLIDSGVLKGTPQGDQRMREVAQNVVAETGGSLDVMVATHEHWDHVSGFAQAKEVWDGLDVDEVWVAWTEDPADELANELRHKKRQALRALVAAAQRLAAAPSEGARATAERIEGVLDFHGDLGAGGVATTEGALQWVKDRQAKLRYLRPGEILPEFGVRVHVLGPPHDRELIKKSDPSKRHPEVYHLAGDTESELGFLAAAGGLTGHDADDRQPFDKWFRMPARQAKAEPLFKHGYDAPSEAWRRVDADWLGAAGPLALHLDSDTNNTSLVLAFELEKDGAVLLFVGDAQVGNWLSWESVEFKDSEVTSADLLARTVLYKVGHHASHNATLEEKGLELMTSAELAALIPVNRVTAEKKKWNMPFPPLYDRLMEKTKGRILDAELGVASRRPAGIAAAEWKRFKKRTDVQPMWVDYTVEW
jgi:hypothetical protein